MKIIKRTDLPRHIAQALGRKRSVFVSVVENGDSVQCTGTMWDGGSRSSWHELDLLSGKLSTPQYVEGEEKELPFGNVQRAAKPRLEVAVVCLGTFCGKTATPHLYLVPENAARWEHLIQES